MVCNRCMYVLEQEMTALGFEVLDIKLGQVVLKDTEDFSQKLGAIKTMLKSNGFELMYDKNQKTTSKALRQEPKIVASSQKPKMFFRSVTTKTKSV